MSRRMKVGRLSYRLLWQSGYAETWTSNRAAPDLYLYAASKKWGVQGRHHRRRWSTPEAALKYHCTKERERLVRFLQEELWRLDHIDPGQEDPKE